MALLIFFIRFEESDILNCYLHVFGRHVLLPNRVKCVCKAFSVIELMFDIQVLCGHRTFCIHHWNVYTHLRTTYHLMVVEQIRPFDSVYFIMNFHCTWQCEFDCVGMNMLNETNYGLSVGLISLSLLNINTLAERKWTKGYFVIIIKGEPFPSNEELVRTEAWNKSSFTWTWFELPETWPEFIYLPSTWI